VLNISRSTLYYRPLPASVEELALMNTIDKLFTKYPLFGSRQIRWRGTG
jgi:putative transposase